MRFLADESCDYTVVTALREAGHDVTAVVDTHCGAEDPVVFAIARDEARTLVTEDKDFGLLAYAIVRGTVVARTCTAVWVSSGMLTPGQLSSDF